MFHQALHATTKAKADLALARYLISVNKADEAGVYLASVRDLMIATIAVVRGGKDGGSNPVERRARGAASRR